MTWREEQFLLRPLTTPRLPEQRGTLFELGPASDAGAAIAPGLHVVPFPLSQYILNRLGEWIAEMSREAPKRTPLGKALFYLAHRWTALTRFFEDGALELDNGAVERAVRGIAIGRRNWLFAGSDAGAERAAVI